MNEPQSTYVRHCLDRLRAGEEGAREDLIRCMSDRFHQLCRQMLGDYARLRRWEETDDVFVAAMLRLHTALASVHPDSPRHFYRLAALQIRRELRDLARHYFGPRGWGTNHATAREQDAGYDDPLLAEPADETHDPRRLNAWAALHAEVERLEADQREVFELIWYHQLSQVETAEILGISRRTVIRRWQAACFRFREILDDDLINSLRRP